MVNWRVDDFDAFRAELKKKGVAVEEKVGEYCYGRFGWLRDPEGTPIEFWQPKVPSECGKAK